MSTSTTTLGKTSAQTSPFWQFSIKFYAVEGVAPACIRLQDEADVDVNLLFFLLWSATQGRAMSEADVKELDRSVVDQLKSLPEKLMLRVARHLVAAGELLDSDPKTAYQHTLAARGRAGRLAVVREAVGEAAYAAGDYAEALSELRSAKRMNGAQDYLAIMADCERALGRPDRALTMLKNASRENFAPPLLAEVVIVEAGARRDRGELDAALRTLENANLNSKSRAPWVARLRYAYAETLLAAGRTADALEWFHRTEAVDVEEITDAGARALEIERSLPKE